MDEHKDWTGDRNSVFKTLGASNHSKRERASRDYYATEPVVIKELFEKESFDNTIWECACGEGHLSKAMTEEGKTVRSTDIHDYGSNETMDFLSFKGIWNGDIITNPPYKYAKDFVEKALEVVAEGAKVAMFLKITFLEGKKRHEMFKKNPPEKVYVYSSRRKCALNGDFDSKEGSSVCYAWFVWTKGYSGNPEIDWIE